MNNTTSTTPVRVVFVATEVAPWSKVGGLADVIGALPSALAARGHSVMTVTPRYAPYADVDSTGAIVSLQLPPECLHEAAYLELEEEEQLKRRRRKKHGRGRRNSISRSRSRSTSSKASSRSRDGSHSTSSSSSLRAPSSEEQHQQQNSVMPSTAELFMTVDSSGVQRVFVDHPLLRTADIYDVPNRAPVKDTAAAAGGGKNDKGAAVVDEPGIAVGDTDDDGDEVANKETSSPSPSSSDTTSFTNTRDQNLTRNVDDSHVATEGVAGDDTDDDDTVQQTNAASQGVLTYLEAHNTASKSNTFTYLEAGQGNNGSNTLGDLDLRYSILCQAALAAPVLLPSSSSLSSSGGGSGGGVVFVANDWPAALQLLRLKFILQENDLDVSQMSTSTIDGAAPIDDLHALMAEHLSTATTAMCIHNLAYQGIFPRESFDRLCLPATAIPALCSTSDWQAVLRMLKSPLAGVSDVAEAGDGCTCGRQHPPETPCDKATNNNHQIASIPPISSNTINSHASRGVNVPDAAALAAARAILLPTLPSSSGGVSLSSLLTSSSDAAECQDSGTLNFMRAALLAADEVVTVSPCYAQEIQQDDGMGCGFREILSARGVTGIMNGIDTNEWNPFTDPHLPPEGRYNHTTFLKGKAYMKQAVQRRLGLKEDPSAALAVFVGRLTEQKGVDLLLNTLPVLLAGPPRPPSSLQIAQTQAHAHAKATRTSKSASLQTTATTSDNNLQFALLGSGESWMQSAFDGLSSLYPGRAVGISGFSEELAHWLLAAGDYVLVPSRFEPCGLVAQCGARYGAVPIVAAVGGLKDLVSDDVGIALPPPSAPGDGAGRNADVQRWTTALRRAAENVGGDVHVAMQRRGMEMDLSWNGPAEEWEQVLIRLAHSRKKDGGVGGVAGAGGKGRNVVEEAGAGAGALVGAATSDKYRSKVKQQQ